MAIGPRPSNRPFLHDAALGVVNELQEGIGAHVSAGRAEDGEAIQPGEGAPLAAPRDAATGEAGAGRTAATGSMRRPADSRAKTSLCCFGFTGALGPTIRSVHPVVAVSGAKQTQSLHA